MGLAMDRPRVFVRGRHAGIMIAAEGGSHAHLHWGVDRALMLKVGGRAVLLSNFERVDVPVGASTGEREREGYREEGAVIRIVPVSTGAHAGRCKSA